MRKCSNFILLHVAVQFSQHHLLQRLSFLYCIVLSPLHRLIDVSAWAYLWALYSVPLIYCFVVLLESEVKECGGVRRCWRCGGWRQSQVWICLVLLFSVSVTALLVAESGPKVLEEEPWGSCLSWFHFL